MKSCEKLFLLFSFLISYSYTIKKYTFTIQKFHLTFFKCSETYGTYTFFFDGTFSGTPSDTDILKIDLLEPYGAKAECKPFSRFDYFECEIDICLDNLTSTNISLPLETPISDKYKIENWEEVISKIPNTTNLIDENVTCIPYIQNNFILSLIESEGCSGKKNLFAMKGYWEWSENIPSIDFNFKIEIDNDNEERDIAECECLSRNVSEFNCKYEGEGIIKFEEKYFKGYYANYLLKNDNTSSNTSIFVEKCLNGSFLNISLLMFIIIVLLI